MTLRKGKPNPQIMQTYAECYGGETAYAEQRAAVCNDLNHLFTVQFDIYRDENGKVWTRSTYPRRDQIGGPYNSLDEVGKQTLWQLREAEGNYERF